MRPKTILLLTIAVIVLMVALQNTHTVTVYLLVWKVMLPQIWLILGAFAVGLLLGYSGAMLSDWRKRRRLPDKPI